MKPASTIPLPAGGREPRVRRHTQHHGSHPRRRRRLPHLHGRRAAAAHHPAHVAGRAVGLGFTSLGFGVLGSQAQGLGFRVHRRKGPRTPPRTVCSCCAGVPIPVHTCRLSLPGITLVRFSALLQHL
jgi:hypothetical protein